MGYMTIIFEITVMLLLAGLAVQVLLWSSKKRVEYVTLKEDEEEKTEEIVMDFLREIEWGKLHEDTTIVIVAVPKKVDTEKLLVKMEETYPQLQLFVGKEDL